jgi:hypothetical protein
MAAFFADRISNVGNLVGGNVLLESKGNGQEISV